MVLTPRSIHSLTLVTISGVSTLGFINNILTELGTLTFPAQLEIISKYFKTRVLFQLLEFYLLLSVKPFKIPFAWFFFLILISGNKLCGCGLGIRFIFPSFASGWQTRIGSSQVHTPEKQPDLSNLLSQKKNVSMWTLSSPYLSNLLRSTLSCWQKL